MTIPSWPGTLPQNTLYESWGVESLYDEPIKTEMEDGPPKMRRRSLTNWSKVSVAYKMTAAQLQTFKTFVQTTLGHGSSMFTLPIYVPGTGNSSKTVFMEGAPKIETMGLSFKISFDVKVRDF